MMKITQTIGLFSQAFSNVCNSVIIKLIKKRYVFVKKIFITDRISIMCRDVLSLMPAA